MQMLIIISVMVFGASIYGAYELGRYEGLELAFELIEQDDIARDTDIEKTTRIGRHDNDIDILRET